MPILFAHRGGARGRRENTLAAFRQALRDGATGLETDVRLTADGVPVLFHDASLRRFGLLTRPVAELDRASLPARVPGLADLYSICGARTPLSVDVKDVDAFPAVIAAAIAAGGSAALENLYLCDGDLTVLGRWRETEPRAMLCLSADGPPGGHAEAIADFRAMADAGLTAVNYRARNWSPALIDAAHDTGLRAFAWDANRGGALRRVVGAGIDALYADRVPWMVASVAASVD